MKVCRICGSSLNEPVYISSGPSITSVRSVCDASLSVYFCPTCLHLQKPAREFNSQYYDSQYRISLESAEHDQLYDKVDGKYVYRTDFQAQLVIDATEIPVGAKILDYGAGKASTLKNVCAERPDLKPYVFDVSDNYQTHWEDFIPAAQQATYHVPDLWHGLFSLVTSHFVMEHVDDPLILLSQIALLLADDGVLFFTVPDILKNPGDMIVTDHINHFSIKSIGTALEKAGLSLISASKELFRGAIVCVAGRVSDSRNFDDDGTGYVERLHGIIEYWRRFDLHLIETSGRLYETPSAIFGAGVYGSYIASKISRIVPVQCFLDNSPHLIHTTHMDLPIISPTEIPESIRAIYSGLNPGIAHAVLEPLRGDGTRELIYFDEGDEGND
ncbi:MAG: methyltransferase domain-containing protein [Desulfuromonadales bacterium]|nr:MAG: methyltransferase domain-containing protein [Desulfuromonadales bacterium]